MKFTTRSSDMEYSNKQIQIDEMYQGSHADFGWIDETSDLIGGNDDWSQNYPEMSIEWPQ